MNQPTEPLDMDVCAQEPIHIPGLIQPYGVLLVIEPADGRIVQASSTAADLLGVPMDALLGTPYTQVLELPDAQPFAVDDQPQHLLHADVRFPQRSAPTDHPWVAAWHLYPEQWLVEIEPRDARLMDVTLREALPLLRSIERDAGIDEAAVRAAKGLRSMIGFDRVMVYRFDEEWNGDVIAEARQPELEAYLGLHYPASDIPAQARALYLRNRVRQIADVRYQPSPIQPTLHPRLGTPVDLSDVSLRSVSPVHLEYLANMGVSATLVSSIVVNDALWGLISCHHYSPHFTSHAMRDATDAVTRALAGRIGALQAVGRARLESVLLTIREKLITDFNDAEHLTVDMLADMAPDLMDVVDADGVAIFHGFPSLLIDTPFSTAAISLFGGQLLSFVPEGGQDVMWLSPSAQQPPTPIRGGAPVCWPYFGRQDQAGDVPAHGFVRTVAWQLTESHREDDGTVVLTLTPPRFDDLALRLRMTLRIGRTLEQRLITENTSVAPVRFTQALHNYFRVGDALKVSVQGLDGLDYLDKYENYATAHRQQGDWSLRDPRDPGRSDRIYTNAGGRYTLTDPVLGRRIVIATEGSRSLVAWNPGEDAGKKMADVGEGWRDYVCLEAANAGPDVIELAPGASHTLTQTISVE